MLTRMVIAACLLVIWTAGAVCAADQWVEIPAEKLADKIHGGLVAQLLGNLNGLPHENKYYEEPGNIQRYTPGLPDGARTDDDTDIEWVYIKAMQEKGMLLLESEEIVRLWRAHINSHIWCANLYSRRLMDIGIEPPLTGNLALNPWSNFNISGQFVCESFGLIAPAMPQTAARTGLHYTHVTIDGEPAQATQLFTSMIATAFVTDDLNAIIDAGVAALDPKSKLNDIVADVRRWHKANPGDWKKTRQRLRDKYTLYESRTRNQNGYELCTGATVAALLYGKGDLILTLVTAFNFGWDADNNAATAATIIGVIKGNDWIEKQGWRIKDSYHNITRLGMPTDETITRFAERLIEVAHTAIESNGGAKLTSDSKTVYRIRRQAPGNVAGLVKAEDEAERLRLKLSRQIGAGLSQSTDSKAKARAAYLAICLDMANSFRDHDSRSWQSAVAALQQRDMLLDVLFNQSPGPAGDKLRAAATAAGIKKP